MHRTIAALLAAAVLTVLPVAAGAAAETGDPSYHKPTVGDCHDYTYDDLFAQTESSAVIDCATAHTAKVIAAPSVPTGVSWTDVAALDKIVTAKCEPAWDKLLGRSELTRALTAYGEAWFLPTKAERTAGARWLRCDVVLWRGKALSPLPYDAAPLVPDPLTDTVRRCLNAKFFDTTCDAGHAWKATGDFNVRKGKYPTTKQMGAIAVKGCTPLVTSKTFRYDPPSKDQWKAGYRVLVCLSKTTS